MLELRTDAMDTGLRERIDAASRAGDVATRLGERLALVGGRRSQQISAEHGERLRGAVGAAATWARAAAAPDAAGPQALAEYLVDAAQRAVLTFDALRERGNVFVEHEKAGLPPVLMYDHEVVLDGRDLPRPCNYVLLRIVPPAGVETFDWKRPYVIVDPRAGHGAGIGGFKADSQVGVALRDGHPVYFVSFRPFPEPGQTLAHVTRAEAAFVKEIARRHPRAPKPIVVGNCQGGWATMLLAATNPDLTGPVVVNGAPLAYWSGRTGGHPMRYNGGLLGGALPALVASDLGAGRFDGAHLVMNFEQLNPGRTWFRKYYELFAEPEKVRGRFLEFEKWWGGFYLMNEAEIRWIVEQLFVGNRLARGEARLERGRQLDLKQIRSPVIVFASHGDNITPPSQALNWIADTYADENEIKIRGQRIVYMVHDKVGHLGIFVSSSIAKREHAEVASTMKTIEALAPGLYEMVIDEQIGEGVDARFLVSFRERRIADILTLDGDGREDEEAFAAVARLSELACEVYDLTARPFVQAMATPAMAEAARVLHPMRAQRYAFADGSPLSAGIGALAGAVAADRRPARPDNPFLQAERMWADAVEHAFDAWRDMRDAWYEWAFFSVYASPAMQWIGRGHWFQRTRKEPEELRLLPEVQAILMNTGRGGFAEAVIRMLIVLAEARGSVRRSRLERSAHVLSHDEPFASLGADVRSRLIHEQSVIVQFEPERAVEALPELLAKKADREKAVGVVEYIAGPLEEMEEHTIAALQRFRKVLGLPRLEARSADADPIAPPAGRADAAG